MLAIRNPRLSSNYSRLCSETSAGDQGRSGDVIILLAAANGGVIFAEPREPFRDASIAALAFPSHTPLIPSKREMPQVIWHVSAVGSWAIGVHVVGAR